MNHIKINLLKNDKNGQDKGCTTQIGGLSDANLYKLASGFHLSVSLIKECNNKCVYCYPFGQNKEIGLNMTFDEAKAAIKAGSDSGFKVFRFTGGEPTLAPFFEDIFKFTLDAIPDSRVIVNTNGHALDSYIDLFEKYKDRMQLRISLDSTNENHKDYGLYKILTPRMKKTLERISNKQIPTRLNMVVMQLNKDE